LGRGVAIERELLDFRTRESQVEPAGPGDPFAEVVGHRQAERGAHLADLVRHGAQVRRVEHADEAVAALFEQLRGACLVGCRSGDDQHRAGALAFAGIERVEQVLDCVVSLVAVRANPDVPRAAEQRVRARLVGQEDGVRSQVAAR
jgi:hypothetical protein